MSKTLSHSQMDCFTQCPRRWRLEKVDHVPQAPSTALILGSAFHAALEADGRAHLDGHARLNRLELEGIGAGELVRGMEEADPTHLLDMGQALDMTQRLVAMVRAYVEHIQPCYEPQQVELALTAPLTDEWQFTGRLDAITGRGIVDFKTASKPWPVGAEHSKPQAHAYTWLYRQDADTWPRQVAFLVFATIKQPDGTYTCDVERRVTRSDSSRATIWLSEAHRTASAIDQARQMGDFPARPGPLCGWCGVRGACKEGQQWMRASGRTAVVPEVTP